MWYNMTLVNATNPLVFIQTTNTYFMQGMLGNLILLVIFCVAMIGFNEFNNNPKVNFMFSSFIIMFLSIMFRILSLVNDYSVYVCILMFACSLAVIKLFEES